MHILAGMYVCWQIVREVRNFVKLVEKIPPEHFYFTVTLSVVTPRPSPSVLYCHCLQYEVFVPERVDAVLDDTGGVFLWRGVHLDHTVWIHITWNAMTYHRSELGNPDAHLGEGGGGACGSECLVTVTKGSRIGDLSTRATTGHAICITGTYNDRS